MNNVSKCVNPSVNWYFLPVLSLMLDKKCHIFSVKKNNFTYYFLLYYYRKIGVFTIIPISWNDITCKLGEEYHNYLQILKFSWPARFVHHSCFNTFFLQLHTNIGKIPNPCPIYRIVIRITIWQTYTQISKYVCCGLLYVQKMNIWRFRYVYK